MGATLIAQRLRHPNVITVYDAVIHDDDRWQVMEYLPSRSLSAILDEDGPLSPDALLQQQPSARPSAADATRSLSEIAGTQPLPVPSKRRRVHRRLLFAENSLAWLNACELLNTREIEAAVGGATEAEPYFADWSCYWSHGPKHLFINFDREQWPLTADDDQEAITIGTRQAVREIGTSGWPDACTVEIYVEETDTEPATNCAQAEALARTIDERLPR